MNMKMKQAIGSMLIGVMLLCGRAAVAEDSAIPAGNGEHEIVNLNAADADTLQRVLSGVGASKAQAIVAYREAHGDFVSVDELLEVKGIGQSILNSNLEKLSLE